MLDEKRKEYICRQVKDFCLAYGAFCWPVDCIALVKKLSLAKRLPLQMQTIPFASNMDASTIKNSSGKYFMIINSKKGGYPFVTSKDCRRNFTIAHELGHIFLGHCEIPEDCKNKNSRRQDEEDANYFAACLLLPEALLRSCNFVSIAGVARAFLVSESALLHRLNELQLQDLKGRRFLRRCELCGCVVSPDDILCVRCGSESFRRMPEVIPYPVLYYPMGYEGALHLTLASNLLHMEAQFEIERMLRQQYDKIEAVPEWGKYLQSQDAELRTILKDCCMLRAGNRFLFCIHCFDLIGLPKYYVRWLTKIVYKVAKLHGISNVLVVNYFLLKNMDELLDWSTWLMRTNNYGKKCFLLS